MDHQKRIALSWVALVLVSVCGGCVTRVPDELRYVAGEGVEKDRENRYVATFMVRPYDEVARGETNKCSGVLIHPRLVLTAGHCVCKKRKFVLPGRADVASIIDGSDCWRAVVVRHVVYEGLLEGTPVEKNSQAPAYVGSKVVPHPRFRALYREDESLVENDAWDLAVVHLKKAVEDVRVGEVVARIHPVELANARIWNAEGGMSKPVVMVGYGYDDPSSGDYGHRYFGTNTIARIDGEVLRVIGRGAHTLPGDSGGPFLMWPKGAKRPLLVGIARGGTQGLVSAFSGIYFSETRKWLDEQIAEAAREDSEARPRMP